MNRTRRNQPRQVTEGKIRARIRALLSEGQTVFPSERDLALQTGGSRSVIREILTEMERNHQLLRGVNGRVINPHANRIPVLFVARGRNMIDNPAWARLWLAFSKRAENTPLELELQLVRYWPEEVEEDAAALRLKNVPYVVLTGNPDFLQPIIGQWRERGTQIVFTDEDNSDSGFPVVALDNSKVGEFAAEELYRHAFRTPALLTQNFMEKPYKPYQNRISGFVGKCRGLGMDFQEDRDLYEVFHRKGMLQNYIRQTVKIAEQKRYDSLFLACDEQLPLILEVFHDQQRFIPGEMGLITFRTQSNADCKARVDSVSDAADEIAEQLFSRILAHADGVCPEIPSVLLPPTILQGETLCIRKTK